MEKEDFVSWCEYAPLGEIYTDSSTDEQLQYVKLRSNDESREINVIQLSPNGLTPDGYSPLHEDFYENLINAIFEDDRELAQIM